MLVMVDLYTMYFYFGFSPKKKSKQNVRCPVISTFYKVVKFLEFYPSC